MSDSAKKYTIAVIPGDGIGKEVTPWAQKALEKAAEGVAEFDYENFDLGAERYLRDGAILPEEEEERIKKTDAILLGAVGDPPWGLTDQADFLNLALALDTQLPAESLLSACQAIEKDLDRVRHEHWGPRTVDIDILLYGQEIWGTEHLKVPHPLMTQRAFVLVPLLEIAENLVEPQTGQAYKKYLSQIDTSDVRKLEQVD